MAKTRSIQSNFLSGELSPLIKGNVGIEQYYQGLEQAENVVVVPQGGVKVREGLEYGTGVYATKTRNTTTPTMPNGGTAANINDDDIATSATTTTGITTGSYIIAEYDIGSLKDIYFIDIKDISLSSGSADDFILEYGIESPPTFFTWQKIADFSLSTTPKNMRFFALDKGPQQFFRIRRNAGGATLGGATVTLSEFNLYEGGQAVNANLLSASLETGGDYGLCFSDKNLMVFRLDRVGGGPLQGIEFFPVPYTSGSTNEYKEVDIAVSGNVILIFHENYPTKRLVNYGDNNPFDAHTAWSLDEATFTKVPQFDFDDSLSPTPVAEQQDITFNTFTRGMRYQVDVKGVLSKTISFAGDATADEQSATEENLRKNLQEMPVFGDTGISVNRQAANRYRITIEDESADAYELFSGFNTTGSTAASLTFAKVATGSPRREDVWSANRGYPRLGAFYEGRLWIGGTRDKAQSLFASKSGDFLNFETGAGEDDEAIFATLASKDGSKINSIYAGRNIQVFTSGGHFVNLETGITPATVNFRLQSNIRCLQLPIQEVEGSAIAADANGTSLKEFTFSFNEDAYEPVDITVLSSHLVNDPESMAALKGSSSDDANLLFVVNGDRTVAVLNKLKSQDINAFTKFTVGNPGQIGGFYSVCVIDSGAAQAAIFAVYRDNTNPGMMLQVYDPSQEFRLDSSAYRTPVSGTIEGLSHLEGETVTVRINNDYLPERVVGATGRVIITSEEQAQYNDSEDYSEAGLDFDVNIQPMPINTNIGSGDNFLRLKKIVRMNIRVYNTAGLLMDGQNVQPTNFGDAAFDGIQTYTGIIEDVYPAEGWSRDIMPLFTKGAPAPLHIQAIDIEVESS